ncbi:MAG: nuclear transport factor 2 family protein [candidate division WOR-3 bacterium]
MASIEELEKKIKELEKRVQALEDIEEIKNLQKTYGYYLEHWMADEIVDLFSDSPEAAVIIARGKFKGKEGIRRWFYWGLNKEEALKLRTLNPYFLHQVMQLSGVVHLDPDGNRAKGRWYGFGPVAIPTPSGRLKAGFMNGIYECEYIKENGKWKILKMHWYKRFLAPFNSWVEPEKRTEPTEGMVLDPNIYKPDERGEERNLYPSAFVPPFHYRHPVTNKEVQTPNIEFDRDKYRWYYQVWF